jgi:protocatechuate 3,4-dioxygenase beta subunit
VGTITDQSGASIPKASIVVTNEATGVVFNTRTNDSGQYQVTALIPGHYSVKASATGFDSELRTGIQIDVQSRPAIDFALKVGHATQTVEVTSATPVLQTQTADVGAVVQRQQINDLPLNGRRYSDLSLLEAGITRNLTNTNNTAPDRFSSNGNWETQNYFSLDGIDNNSGSTNLQESTV